MSIGATQAVGFDLLGLHWDVMEERAANFGTVADRAQWRLVGMMHIAETRSRPYRDVEFGMAAWFDYFQHTAAFPQMSVGDATRPEMVDFVNESGLGSIGTADVAANRSNDCRSSRAGSGVT